MQATQKRMSVRNVALTYGIPTRVVVRAIENGALPAVKTTTDTGRERSYISKDDAELWFTSLLTSGSSASIVEG
jgi:hypothetical protein